MILMIYDHQEHFLASDCTNTPLDRIIEDRDLPTAIPTAEKSLRICFLDNTEQKAYTTRRCSSACGSPSEKCPMSELTWTIAMPFSTFSADMFGFQTRTQPVKKRMDTKIVVRKCTMKNLTRDRPLTEQNDAYRPPRQWQVPCAGIFLTESIVLLQLHTGISCRLLDNAQYADTGVEDLDLENVCRRRASDCHSVLELARGHRGWTRSCWLRPRSPYIVQGMAQVSSSKLLFHLDAQCHINGADACLYHPSLKEQECCLLNRKMSE